MSYGECLLLPSPNSPRRCGPQRNDIVWWCLFEADLLAVYASLPLRQTKLVLQSTYGMTSKIGGFTGSSVCEDRTSSPYDELGTCLEHIPTNLVAYHGITVT